MPNNPKWHYGIDTSGDGEFWWVMPIGYTDDTNDDLVFWFGTEEDAETACRALNLHARAQGSDSALKTALETADKIIGTYEKTIAEGYRPEITVVLDVVISDAYTVAKALRSVSTSPLPDTGDGRPKPVAVKASTLIAELLENLTEAAKGELPWDSCSMSNDSANQILHHIAEFQNAVDLFTSWNLATIEGLPKLVSKRERKRLQYMADEMVKFCARMDVPPQTERTRKAQVVPQAANDNQKESKVA